jgi:hypothetical protein
MNEKVTVKLVRGTDGSVNESETLKALSEQLSAMALAEQGDLEQIAEAVTASWDNAPTRTEISMGALASEVFHTLGFDHTQFPVVQERISNYVRSATDTYVVVRGAGGGVKKLDRLSAEEQEKALSQRAKLVANAAAKAEAKAKKVA